VEEEASEMEMTVWSQREAVRESTPARVSESALNPTVTGDDFQEAKSLSKGA
jgi:hypothetical protein